jgi:multidrug resistance protein MdtO
MLQGPTPEFDMTIARDRVIGVLIGNVVSYFVLTRVWPVSVALHIDPAIRALLQRLSVMMTTVGVPARRSVAAEVLAARDAIESDLKLVAYEPRATRPQPSWRGHRLEAMRAILTLTGPLLLSADRWSAASVEFSRRLRELAHTPDGAEPVSTVAAGGSADPAQAAAVRTLLGSDFHRLELAMAERYVPA